MEKKELTTTTDNLPAEQQSGFVKADINLAELFAQEMDGLSPSFDRIKVPSGGGVAFEVPGNDVDNPDLAKEVKAVILYHHPSHSYYKEKYTGGNNPPDCASSDGHIGIEFETGVTTHCKDCPNNQFGSSESGGKACKQKRRIYLLREGEVLPILLSLPTGSLQEYSKYIMRLLSKGKKSNSVVTRFTLKKAQNTGGISYSQAICSVDRDLTASEQVVIDDMTEQIKRIAGKVTITDEE